jgi:hypothetical protein
MLFDPTLPVLFISYLSLSGSSYTSSTTTTTTTSGGGGGFQAGQMLDIRMFRGTCPVGTTKSGTAYCKGTGQSFASCTMTAMGPLAL